MNRKSLRLLGSFALAGGAALALSARGGEAASEAAGWATNGPAVFALVRHGDADPASGVWFTNRVFDHYLPESLNHFIWTNVVAHTNGRSTLLWSERSHPAGWPTNAPLLAWNPKNLLWGMKGMTGLSPCWASEGSTGQVPITALTRRHGYTRGHGMGPEGVRTSWAGYKVWFVTARNERVEATIARAVVRLTRGDYTIFLFREDLPAGIEPLRVVMMPEVYTRYPFCEGAPRPLYQTEQLGQVNAAIAGFTMNAWKGGDSGSPDLLPLGNELVFCGGRGTATPRPEMQVDMDTLCTLEGLDPQKYQLQWVDLSRFPTYTVR